MIKKSYITLLCIIGWSVSCLSQCQFDFPNYNVSFDLSPLTVPSGDYEIPHTALQEWTFHINFCARAVTSSSSCNTHSAYAFAKSNSNCYKLSSSNGGPSTASLITTQDPSFGIILHYTQGDWCADGSKYRSISLHLMCDPNITNIETTRTAYFEDQNSGKCTVKISPIHSSYACPIACHSNQDGELCSNHGECGYDHTVGAAKCFCFHGYIGSVCEQSITVNTINDPYSYINTASKYVYHFYDNKVMYNLSWFSISTTTFPKGRTGFIDLLDPGRFDYYWSAFDYPIDTSACPTSNADASYFYQIDGGTGCFSFGAQYNVELYDTYNPVKGLTISYTNGDPDWCPYWNEANERKRSIEMTLICADFNFEENKNSIDLNTQIYEVDQCVYEATLFDIGVCPYQCITHSNNEIGLCSSHGICSFDKVVGFVRCLCNQGYTGVFCEFTLPPTNDPTSNPTKHPSQNQTKAPSNIPTTTPSSNPSFNPSVNPTESPSQNPSVTPSSHPTATPSFNPSISPTPAPTSNPTIYGSPTMSPTLLPTKKPSFTPTLFPTETQCGRSDIHGIQIQIEFQYHSFNVSNSASTQIKNILSELIQTEITTKNLTNTLESENFNISVNEYYNTDEDYEMTVNAILFVCGNQAQEILVISIENKLQHDFINVVNNKTILFIQNDNIHIQVDLIRIIDKGIDTESTPMLTSENMNKWDNLQAKNSATPLWMIFLLVAAGFLSCCILLIGIIILKKRKTKQQKVAIKPGPDTTVFANMGSMSSHASDDLVVTATNTIALTSMNCMGNTEGNTVDAGPGSLQVKRLANSGSNLEGNSGLNNIVNNTHGLNMSPSEQDVDIDCVDVDSDNEYVMTPNGNDINSNIQDDEFVVGDDEDDAYNLEQQNMTTNGYWSEDMNEQVVSSDDNVITLTGADDVNVNSDEFVVHEGNDMATIM